MFWLFKRKKVADKKDITPCVCDNGNDPVPDAYNLQDFGSSSDSSTPSSRLTLGEDPGRGVKKGYQRLQGEEQTTALCPPPPDFDPAPRLEVKAESSSSGTESSSDCERDYFAGFTDTDDEEEELTCNVCERSFSSVRCLEQHQLRKRHYGCSICDSIFPALMALELHKETLDHWSDYELRVKRSQEQPSDDSDSEPEEHRVYSSATKRRDELKRLLL